jgi:hypothetical protein
MPGYFGVSLSAFASEMHKIAVSEEEALDAARIISQDPRSRARKYFDAGAVGAALNPFVDASGHAVKGFVETPGSFKQRARGAAREVRLKSTRGEVARTMHRGLFGGMALQAGREGLQARRAKDTVDRFLRENRGS